MSKWMCLSISLLLLVMNAHPQVNFVFDKEKADSLELRLDSVSGKDRVDVLNQLSFLYNRHEPEKADNLAIEALYFSMKLEYPRGEAFAYYNLGILDYLDADFSDAADKLFTALNIYKDLPDTAMMIDVHSQLASTVYFSETDKNKAIEILRQGLNLAILSKNNLRIAQYYASFGYIANTYSGDGKTGKQMFEKYYHYIEGYLVNRIEKALMIASYGDSFHLLGDTRTSINKYLESFNNYSPEVVEERALMSQCCSTLGNMYFDIGMPDSAVYFYRYGIELSRKYFHLYGLYRNYFHLARYYYEKGLFDNAITCCDSAVYYGSISSSRGSYYGRDEFDRVLGASMEIYFPVTRGYKKFLAWSYMQLAYNLLLEIYESQGDMAMAYSTSRSLSGIKDSISVYNKNKELREIQAKYETAKKEEEIASLSNANQLQQMKIRQNSFFLAGMGGLLILIVLLAVILLRQNKLKADHQAILLKQRLFRSQMNPHFIFNSLGSIQSSIINEEPDKAVRYLSRFSKLMRNILDSSIEETVSLSEELTTIENYLELQKVRFASKFEYTIDLDESIDPENTFIPPMLAQPFIENAIEHGIKHKEGKGQIDIRCRRGNDVTIFEVEDDGVGREKARDLLLKQEESHKSLATVITRERIAALNKRKKKKITLEIIDLTKQNGQAAGTLVRFVIPIG